MKRRIFLLVRSDLRQSFGAGRTKMNVQLKAVKEGQERSCELVLSRLIVQEHSRRAERHHLLSCKEKSRFHGSFLPLSSSVSRELVELFLEYFTEKQVFTLF